MAHIAKAHILGLATEPKATAEAKALVAKIRTLPLRERELSHVAILDLLLGGNWTTAALALGRHNARYPRDLVALQSGHLVDFYRANAREPARPHRACAAQVVARRPGLLDPSRHARVRSRGMRRLRRAEELGRRALSTQPLDCWAHHAVAHVMEMQGRAEDGVGWMIAREPLLVRRRQLLQGPQLVAQSALSPRTGQIDEALALYDGPIRAEPQPRRARPRRRVGAAVAVASYPMRTWVSAGKSLRRRGSSMRTAGPTPSMTGTPSCPTSARAEIASRGNTCRLRSRLPRKHGCRQVGAGHRVAPDQRISRVLARRLPDGRRAAVRRTSHRERFRRQSRSARHHRLDADRGCAARRVHRFR